VLPSTALPDILDAISVGRESVALEPSRIPVERVVYAPHLIVMAEPLLAEIEGPATTPTSTDRGSARSYGERYFDEVFSKQYDPWDYTSPYEQVKYQHTLALLPEGRFGRALELGCAEGHFTVQLAARVGSLVAADVSRTALGRAAGRCAPLSNIEFVQLDLTRDVPPGSFDLIACSEVLYYVDDPLVLRQVVNRIADALVPNGYLLSAHSNLSVDEPSGPGFDWGLKFGAKVIADAYSRVPCLRLIAEHRTPLYRIQLFQRRRRLALPFGRQTRPLVTEDDEQPTALTPEVAGAVRWTHTARPTGSPHGIATDRLPVLMYHRVAHEGQPSSARYRVSPREFDKQLSYLRDAGYYSVRLRDWRAAREEHAPLPGRAVLLTFDDGYADFAEYAWPLLKRYGFSALVFVVAGLVGGTNEWDSAYGETVPLLGWSELRRLRDEGAELGSHTMTHVALTAESPDKVLHEAIRSRTLLRRKLAVPVDAFAYPFGEVDGIVRHLVGAAGYTFGFTCGPGPSTLWDSELALPRIEVSGFDTLDAFVDKLPRTEPNGGLP
jgi:peptidoglycan/xylan/chitin deacetylase (PgdA/CDA1 family)